MLLLAVIELRVTRATSDWMMLAEAVAGVDAEEDDDEEDDDEEEEDPLQLDDVMDKSEKVVVVLGLM